MPIPARPEPLEPAEDDRPRMLSLPAAAVDDATPLTAVPTEEQLVVTVAEVARRLGKEEASLTPQQRFDVLDAITDAQAMVEGEINRPLFQTRHVLTGVLPYMLAPGGVLDSKSWPVLSRVDDDVEVVSAVASPDGTFDLTVLVGINGRKEEPIRAFVRAHAVEALRLNPRIQLGQIAVTSVSAEGQSISYEKRSVQQGAAGALPTVATLRRYKRVAAYQAPTRYTGSWPYRGQRTAVSAGSTTLVTSDTSTRVIDNGDGTFTVLNSDVT